LAHPADYRQLEPRMSPPLQVIQLPPAPPAPPRTVTRAVRRRSLLEPRVRFWWVAAVVLSVIAIYCLVSRAVAWGNDLHLALHGESITATIYSIGDSEQVGRYNYTPDSPVTLYFVYNNTEYYDTGYLEGRHETVNLKQAVTIRINPDNPHRWTYLTTPPPLGPVFLSFGLVIPFAIAAAVVSFLMRRRLLGIWRTGIADPFIVEATQQTALAPRSRAVRCRAVEGRTNRLVQVFIPRHKGAPKTGDVLWLIHPAGKTTVVLAAMNYG
jgi:hypothetical protein